MKLQKLLEAMTAAKAALDAKPEDAALKTAHDEAKKAYDDAKAAADAGDEEEPDESKLDDKTKAHLKKLRDENAKHRLKNKDLTSQLGVSEAQKKAILKAAGIESEEEKPEEKLKASQTKNQELEFRSAILEMALENGIPKEDVKFFTFLVQEATATLKDNEELSDEKMAEIVADVQKRGGGKASTSVGGGKGDKGSKTPEGGKGGITLDMFCKMTFSEKAKLYGENPDLYTQLKDEAKAKNRLI